MSPVTSDDSDRARALQSGNRLWLVLLLAMALNLWAYIYAWQTLTARAPTQLGLAVPDFTLTDLAGQRFRLAAAQTPILLSFFSVANPASRAELSLLLQWSATRPEARVMLITSDDSRAVAAYVTEARVPFTVLLDQRHSIWEAYHLRGTPTTFLVDARRVLRAQRVGAFTDLAQLDQFYSQLAAGLTVLTTPTP
jgi:peroxiredoxin